METLNTLNISNLAREAYKQCALYCNFELDPETEYNGEVLVKKLESNDNFVWDVIYKTFLLLSK